MHYSLKKSRRVLVNFRVLYDGSARRMLPIGMVLIVAFVVWVVVTESGNPWTARMVTFFLLCVCNMLFTYVRPDLHFDLYRRYWPIKLHPLAQAEGDLLYRQLRQLAFSMGEPRIERHSGPRSSLAESGDAQ